MSWPDAAVRVAFCAMIVGVAWAVAAVVMASACTH